MKYVHAFLYYYFAKDIINVIFFLKSNYFSLIISIREYAVNCNYTPCIAKFRPKSPEG